VKSSSRRVPSSARSAGQTADTAAAVGGAGNAAILRLQQTAGNAAVSGLLRTVQRAPVTVGGTAVPGTADEDLTAFRYHLLGLPQDEFDAIRAAFEELAPDPDSWNGRRLAEMREGRAIAIAGHGLYSDDAVRKITERDKLGEPLPKRRRRGTPEPVRRTFTVPDGVTLLMYAPHGASINNSVAQDIERGYVPPKDHLELVSGDGKRTEAMPDGDYPYRAGPGTEVPNYRVGRPDRLTVDRKSRKVRDAKLLSQIVEELRREGYSVIHYTCCSATEVEDPSLFPWKGWWVRYTKAGEEAADAAIAKTFGATG
jgi:hypothetical protein